MSNNLLILHHSLPMLVKILLYSGDPILPERENSEHRFSRFRAALPNWQTHGTINHCKPQHTKPDSVTLLCSTHHKLNDYPYSHGNLVQKLVRRALTKRSLNLRDFQTRTERLCSGIALALLLQKLAGEISPHESRMRRQYT